ncbi:MAG TPA: rhodanese-like domain-containing protein [Treponemataceae bacterium]|nr:rhodanese-like domain-containing protein [Treponemataceae bacterium]
MKRIAIIILSIITVISISLAIYFYSQTPVSISQYRVLTQAAELDALLSLKGTYPLLVDLRDNEDFDTAHIANFLNFSFDDGGKRLATWIAPYKKDKPIILICYSGNRSARAFELLVLMGFTHITDFTSGYEAYAIEKGNSFTPEKGSCNCPK